MAPVSSIPSGARPFLTCLKTCGSRRPGRFGDLIPTSLVIVSVGNSGGSTHGGHVWLPWHTSEAEVTTTESTGHIELVSELATVSQSLETRPPSAVLEWAFERFGSDITLACSFQDIVLVDLAVKINPGVEVIFLDTEAHFEETLSFVEQVRAHYDLNLVVTHPGPDAEAWPCGTAECCQRRKVAPLKAAVAGKQAWITALKRVDAPTRAAAPIVSYDDAFSLVKINPMATWTDDDIAYYEKEHGLLRHPLIDQGYLSIGCAPTTKPVAPGADPRSGRWAGTGKVECGLHG